MVMFIYMNGPVEGLVVVGLCTHYSISNACTYDLNKCTFTHYKADAPN
jgi:hypothetical protein